MSAWDVFWAVTVAGPPTVWVVVHVAREVVFELWMRGGDHFAPRAPAALEAPAIPPARGLVVEGELVEA
jgi:hypothetical protein